MPVTERLRRGIASINSACCPSIQSIILATAMILDGVADREAVMALSAVTASPSAPSSIDSAVRGVRCHQGWNACVRGPCWKVHFFVEHSESSPYRRSNSHRRRNMKRATLNTEEMT